MVQPRRKHSKLKLRTYSEVELARCVMYGRILRIQIARKRRRSSGAQGSRVRRAAAPAPPPAAADETGPGGNSEPWPHHPLALLGFYKQYLPADGEPHDIAPSAGAKSPFASHSAVLFRDTALDSLNPGWEPTVHVFEIPAAAAKRLNAALEPEMLALAASGRGLRVSNRGGGYHSEQHLFQRGGAALGRLEALVCAAAAAASRAERQLAAASHSDDDASSLQPSSVGGAPNGERPEDRPVNSWVNVGRAGAYHGLHDHHGSVWSGVYYVSVPPDPPGSTSGGRIVFKTAMGGAVGRQAAEQLGKNSEKPFGWCRFAVIDPKPGRLVLFPGWLQHAVTPLPLERQAGARISISFNVGREGEDDGEEE